jgi:Cu2+-exporting ATPase
MRCAGCANAVEKAVGRLPGVETASVNLASGLLTVACRPGQPTLSDIEAAVRNAGYTPAGGPDAGETASLGHYRRLKRQAAGAWALAIPLMLIGMLGMSLPYAHWIMMALALSIMTFFGRTFYVEGLRQALRGHAGMDTLVALSTSIAFLFSLFNTIYPQYWSNQGAGTQIYYESAGMIVAFVLLGKLLEEKAKSRAASSIRRLMEWQPRTACRIGDEGEEKLPVGSLAPGDLLRIRPGDKIPVDGLVQQGSSTVDESMLSGEPLPVWKQPGDKLWAGAINREGSLVMQTTGVGEATVLGQILRMVQEAQGSKAPVQRLADRISRVFVPAVVAIALLAFGLWMLIGGVACFPYALLSAVSALVIACPCALGLATPAALMVGMGKAAGQHILIKDACALENLCRIDTLVVDKTGTLTEGVPKVVDSYWLSETDVRYLDILYTAETRSEHPLAGAILRWMNDSGASLFEPESFESIAGQGVCLTTEGAAYWVGNRTLADRFRADIPAKVDRHLKLWEAKGYGIVYYGGGPVLLAAMAVADVVKPNSYAAIERLKQHHIDVHLLTGDSEPSARSVASALGISYVKAGALPQEKENYVKALQATGKKVAMMGDGINDTQALARADVSIAMGKGTDVAMDVAMVTLMTSDPLLIPQAIRLSRQTVRLIRQNLFWAFIFNLIGIPLAAGALYPAFGILLNPMIAGAAMAFSSVAVVANSLRLKYINI